MSDSLKSMLIEYLQQKQQTNQSKKVDNEINMSNPQPQEEQQEQSTSNQDTEQQGQEEENTNNQNSKQDDTNTSKEPGEEPGDYQDNNYQDNEYSDYNHSENICPDDEYPDEEYHENNNQDGIYKQDNYSDEYPNDNYQDEEYDMLGSDNFEYDNDGQEGSSPNEQDNISDMNIGDEGEVSTKGCLSDTPTDQSDVGDLEEILNNIKDSENDEHLFDEEDYNHLLEMIKDSSSSSVLEEFLNDDSVKLEVVVDKKVSPKWWDDLVKLFKTTKPKDNSYKKLNKKFQYMNILLPYKSSPRKILGEAKECHIYLDTSGSMTNTDLNIALSTLKLATKYFKKEDIKFFGFNNEVYKIPVNDLYKNKIFGTGGTDINPVVFNIEKEGKNIRGTTLNIVITDGGFDPAPIATYYSSLKNKNITVLLMTSSTLGDIVSTSLKSIKNKNLKYYIANNAEVVEWVVPENVRKRVNKLYE